MRIWFNHWFSTAFHLISLMEEMFPNECEFIGSNSNSNAVYRRKCSEWYVEEELPEQEYTDFCLQFCKEHSIDVFVPRRGLLGIVKNLKLFEREGVRVLADYNEDSVTLLDDKIQTYKFFQEHYPELIPDYRLCRNLEEFQSACNEIKSASGRLCYKLSVDEGARSFRVIDNSIESLTSLYSKPGTKVTQRAAETILSQYDFSIPVLVMPYLSGADVSVDCLSTHSGKIILPRFKIGRYSDVRPDEGISHICSEIMDLLELKKPSNIQFKLQGDKPYLLEINTRMSGGVQLSCLATGINLPGIALAELINRPCEWNYPNPWLSCSTVNLETPVVVSKKVI